MPPTAALPGGGTLRGHAYIHERARDAVVRKLAYNYATDDMIP